MKFGMSIHIDDDIHEHIEAIGGVTCDSGTPYVILDTNYSRMSPEQAIRYAAGIVKVALWATKYAHRGYLNKKR